MERRKVWKVLVCIVFTNDRNSVHMRELAGKYEKEEGSFGLGRRATQPGSQLLTMQE